MSPLQAILFIATTAYLTSCAGLYQPAARTEAPARPIPMSFASHLTPVNSRTKTALPNASVFPAVAGSWQLLTVKAKPGRIAHPVKSPGILGLPDLLQYQKSSYQLTGKPYIIWFSADKPAMKVSETGAVSQALLGLNPSVYALLGRSLQMEQEQLIPAKKQSKVVTYSVYKLLGKTYLRTERPTTIQVGEYCFPYTVVSTFGQVEKP